MTDLHGSSLLSPSSVWCLDILVEGQQDRFLLGVPWLTVSTLQSPCERIQLSGAEPSCVNIAAAEPLLNVLAVMVSDSGVSV